MSSPENKECQPAYYVQMYDTSLSKHLERSLMIIFKKSEYFLLNYHHHP